MAANERVLENTHNLYYEQKYEFLYPPQTVFVGGYTVFTLSDRTNNRPTERVSVTFCFLNNFKNH